MGSNSLVTRPQTSSSYNQNRNYVRYDGDRAEETCCLGEHPHQQDCQQYGDQRHDTRDQRVHQQQSQEGEVECGLDTDQGHQSKIQTQQVEVPESESKIQVPVRSRASLRALRLHTRGPVSDGRRLAIIARLSGPRGQIQVQQQEQLQHRRRQSPMFSAAPEGGLQSRQQQQQQ